MLTVRVSLLRFSGYPDWPDSGLSVQRPVCSTACLLSCQSVRRPAAQRPATQRLATGRYVVVCGDISPAHISVGYRMPKSCTSSCLCVRSDDLLPLNRAGRLLTLFDYLRWARSCASRFSLDLKHTVEHTVEQQQRETRRNTKTNSVHILFCTSSAHTAVRPRCFATIGELRLRE